MSLQSLPHAGTGGLRGHSIGAFYPYIFVATKRHAADPLSWFVMDGRTGNRSQTFRTAAAARIHATSLLIRNGMWS